MKPIRFISIIIAIVLTFSMSVTAFATENTTEPETKTETVLPGGAVLATSEYKADTAVEEKQWDNDADEYTDANGVTWRYIHKRNYIVSKNDSNYLYRVREDGTISVIYDYLRNEPEGEVIFPSTLDGKTVTKIDAFALFGCHDVTGVRIPDTVIEVGYTAFTYCTNLERIVIGRNVTKFNAEALGNIGSSFEICFVGSEEQADEITVWSYRKMNAKKVCDWNTFNTEGAITYNTDASTLVPTTTEPTLAEWFKTFFVSLFEVFISYYKVIFNEMGTTLEHWFGNIMPV